MSKKPQKYVYALYDSRGDLAGFYNSKEEAEDDAWGPRFMLKFNIRVYSLLKKADEP